MPVPPGEERGEMGKFFFCFQSYLIFMFFHIYHVFCIPEYLTRMYPLCADVGPVHPADFVRTRWRPRLEAGPSAAGGPVAAGGPPAGEAERVLR
jgi:hypothetical protein